jgi:hypothetical protein
MWGPLSIGLPPTLTATLAQMLRQQPADLRNSGRRRLLVGRVPSRANWCTPQPDLWYCFHVTEGPDNPETTDVHKPSPGGGMADALA